ncbi:hypothetical protein [Rheinheimera sp. NSM]|uniref:hypothetical protein n=1 Tax=Rheinheimera sp. NSM TaxID=3457884 RepID=UPI004035FC0A
MKAGLLSGWLLSATMLFCLPCYAQFDIAGEGKVQLTKGGEQEFDFGFSYFRQDGSYRFIVGRHSLSVHTVPQKYSLALILQNDQQVWVPDFINEPLSGFELQIEGYKLKLYQQPGVDDQPGKFILQFNDESYQFSRGPGQVNFYFTEQGIKDVRVEGMFKPKR